MIRDYLLIALCTASLVIQADQALRRERTNRCQPSTPRSSSNQRWVF